MTANTRKASTTKRTTKASTKAKATKASTKPDPYAKVVEVEDTSAAIVYSLMTAETDYQGKVASLGPVIAKRLAGGETNAAIAREVVALAKAQGQTIKQNTAAQRVRRYGMIGEAILKADAKADVSEVIEKASAKARGNSSGKGKAKASGAPKSVSTLIEAFSGTAKGVTDRVIEDGTPDEQDKYLLVLMASVRRMEAARKSGVAKVEAA